MVGQQLDLSPYNVKFTQDSITEEFGRGTGETIEQTFRELLYGETSVGALRRISVVRHEGSLWVVSGNRRLYVYRKLKDVGRLTTVPVTVVPINMARFVEMKTTKNDGSSVLIRSDRRHTFGDKLDDRLNRIVQQWNRDGRPTDGIPARPSSYSPPIYDLSRMTLGPGSGPRSSTSPGFGRVATGVSVPIRYEPERASSTASSSTYRAASPRASVAPAPRETNDSWCVIL